MTLERSPTLPEGGTEAPTLAVGEVVHADDADRCLVRLEGGAVVPCDVLHSSSVLPLVLTAGETVLVWGAGARERGVVMGRVGASGATGSGGVPAPDELVLEAGQKLVLRCGDGSITIRNDGKILIKGKDLVSHAKRVNRVKGGSVSIN